MKRFQLELIVLTIATMLITSTVAAHLKSIGEIQTDLKPSSRIIGGKTALPGEFPYQVSLTMVGGILNLIILASCGGSLIRANWVLTAGHCGNQNPIINSYAIFIVRVGSNSANSGGQTQEIVPVLLDQFGNAFPHPDYNPETLEYDICLLKMNHAFLLNSATAIIPLPPQNTDLDLYEGIPITVSGFGKISNNGQTSNVLLYTDDLLVISQFDCELEYISEDIPEMDICAQDKIAPISSTCNGDSGGPATAVLSDNIHYQIGIVSFGSSTGCDTAPNGFTRTDYFADWIEGIIFLYS